MALVMDTVDMVGMALVEDPVLVQVVGMALVVAKAVGMEPVVARAKALVEGIVKALAKVSVGTMKPLVIVRTLME
jgi:hypothetical protein